MWLWGQIACSTPSGLLQQLRQNRSRRRIAIQMTVMTLAVNDAGQEPDPTVSWGRPWASLRRMRGARACASRASGPLEPARIRSASTERALEPAPPGAERGRGLLGCDFVVPTVQSESDNGAVEPGCTAPHDPCDVALARSPRQAGSRTRKRNTIASARQSAPVPLRRVGVFDPPLRATRCKSIHESDRRGRPNRSSERLSRNTIPARLPTSIERGT